MKREQKIVLKALISAKNGSQEAEGLTREEKALFESIVVALKESHVQFEVILGTNASEDKNRRVKMLKDIPEFVGKDMNNYGPFKNGENVLLPGNEAERLSRLGLAEVH